MSFARLPLLVLMVLASSGHSEGAEDPAQIGESIAREADQRDLGYGDTAASLTMILEDRRGTTRERHLRISTLEILDEREGDKSLVIFDEPRDIRGTALLSHAHILDTDDQWLFLPALKRVKRIASVNRSGSFVGSGFAYEDLTGQELEKYSYQWLRDEPCGDLECYVVERRPLYENSGYTRLVTWFDKAEYRIQRVDYYDLSETLLKTLTLNDYRHYLDTYWRAHELIMDNYKTGRETKLIYGQYEFQTGLSEDDFVPGNLERLR